MNPRGRGVDDELVNLGLILVAAAAGLAAALWLGGVVAAFVTGNPLPSGGIAAGFGVLTHAGAPGVALGVPGRSSTCWWAPKAPACQSILSTRVVLPWSTWATIATLRTSLRDCVGIDRFSQATPHTAESGEPGVSRPSPAGRHRWR